MPKRLRQYALHMHIQIWKYYIIKADNKTLEQVHDYQYPNGSTEDRKIDEEILKISEKRKQNYGYSE